MPPFLWNGETLRDFILRLEFLALSEDAQPRNFIVAVKLNLGQWFFRGNITQKYSMPKFSRI